MALFSIRPAAGCPSLDEAAVKADFDGALRYPQCRLGQLAVYLPAMPGNTYIPLSVLTNAHVRRRILPTVGCCGNMYRVDIAVLSYLGTFTMVQFGSKAQAGEFLAALCQRRPGLDTTVPAAAQT